MKKFVGSFLFILIFATSCFACNCQSNFPFQFYRMIPHILRIEQCYNRNYRHPQSYEEVLYIQKTYERGRYH